MADVMDVANTLVSIIAATLYPNGTSQPSIVGVGVKVYSGWPVPAQLDADLAANPSVVNVSVYPTRMERNTTRYLIEDIEVSAQTPTLALTATASTVTVSGTTPPASNPHNIAVFVDDFPYLYAVQAQDTPETIAAQLAALMAPSMDSSTLSIDSTDSTFDGSGPISVSGATITFSAGQRIGACRVGTSGLIAQEIARQDRLFQITVWASTPALRDQAGALIDANLKSRQNWRITLPDQSVCWLRYHSSPYTDDLQKQQLYRRDLLFAAEYPTLSTDIAQDVLVGRVNVSENVNGQSIPITTVEV